MTRITILTQVACPACDRAGRIITRLAEHRPIQVRSIPLASDTGRALANRHGILFAPGVLVDGELFGYGRLSEKKLIRHLDRLDRGRPDTA